MLPENFVAISTIHSFFARRNTESVSVYTIRCKIAITVVLSIVCSEDSACRRTALYYFSSPFIIFSGYI